MASPTCIFTTLPCISSVLCITFAISFLLSCVSPNWMLKASLRIANASVGHSTIRRKAGTNGAPTVKDRGKGWGDRGLPPWGHPAARPPNVSCPVFAIVTGMEHSGTTIVSNLIKNAPGALGGFECGMLLAERPQDFKYVTPFSDRMQESGMYWHVATGTMDRIYAARSTCDMYYQLWSGSALFESNRNDYVLDKTPRYIYHLPTVLTRMPGAPCIVIRKSEARQVQSFIAKKRKHSMSAERAEDNVKAAQRSLELARNQFENRIFEVSYEALEANPDIIMEQVFTFLGAEWRTEYLNMTAFRRKLYRSPPITKKRADSIGRPFRPRQLS